MLEMRGNKLKVQQGEENDRLVVVADSTSRVLIFTGGGKKHHYSE